MSSGFLYIFFISNNRIYSLNLQSYIFRCTYRRGKSSKFPGSDMNSRSLYCGVNRAFILAEEWHTRMVDITYTCVGSIDSTHSISPNLLLITFFFCCAPTISSILFWECCLWTAKTVHMCFGYMNLMFSFRL